MNPDFKDKLKNDDIINQFSDAKSELENLKNDNQMKNELSSLIVTSIDMGIILNNLATNCKAGWNELIGSGDQNQKESIEFINICRIINRLIDNRYNDEAKKICRAFPWETRQKEREELSMIGIFIWIFNYNSYKNFWKYVAKISNIESYIDKLNNQDTKFENEECKKLHERFLKYKEAYGKRLEEIATEIIENQELRPVYIVELTIGKDGALSSIKKVYPKVSRIMIGLRILIILIRILMTKNRFRFGKYYLWAESQLLLVVPDFLELIQRLALLLLCQILYR